MRRIPTPRLERLTGRPSFFNPVPQACIGLHCFFLREAFSTRQPLAPTFYSAATGNQRIVDSKPGTMPEREAAAYDLDALAVVDTHIEVHGRQSNANAGPSFLAEPCDGPLDRNGLGGEDARRGTSGAVVAVLIEWASAGAKTRAKRQGKPKATEDEDPKVGRGDGYILGLV